MRSAVQHVRQAVGQTAADRNRVRGPCPFVPGVPPPTAAPERMISSCRLRPFSGSSKHAHIVDHLADAGGPRFDECRVGLNLNRLRDLADFQPGLITGLPPTCRTIPVCAKVRNPGSAASSLYGPTDRFGRTYDPVSLLTAVRCQSRFRLRCGDLHSRQYGAGLIFHGSTDLSSGLRPADRRKQTKKKNSNPTMKSERDFI